MKYIIILLISCFGLAKMAQAQEVVPEMVPPLVGSVDTIPKLDSSRHYFVRSPKRAGMYAAILPGSGQIYNSQYWKLPIVYAGMGTGVGYIIYNISKYNGARREIAARANKTPLNSEKYGALDDTQLQQEQDYRRQNLDISALLTGVAYFLQIIDAVVSNHLKGFDITPDISMHFNPLIVRPQQVGFGIAFNIH